MFYVQVEVLSSIFVIGCLIIFLLIRRKKEKAKLSNNHQIPTVSSWPLLWNIASVCKLISQNEWPNAFNPGVQLIQNVTALCHLFRNEKIFKASWAGHVYVCVFHPETAEAVLKSNTVINKDWVYKALHPWLGTGLLTSADDKWRRRRKLLTPAFHFRILEDFVSIFNEQSKILVEKLRESNKKEIDMCSFVTPCTLDIIGDSVMGVHLNAQKCADSDYVKAVKNISSAVVDWFVKPWFRFPLVFYLSSTGKQYRENIAIVHEYAKKVIKRRKEKLLEEVMNDQKIDDFQQERDDLGIQKRRAFLDLLLYHHIMDGSLTEEDVREEVDTFMFEGHDTTAMAICWTLQLLGLHPSIQDKVYEEIFNIFGEDKERPVTTADIKEMKYLEYVVKESLRLYPSVPYILRQSREDIKTGDYIIPANCTILIYIYGILRNPDIFPNQDVFDPDRFLSQNCEERDPFAFVPFSAGPRNCIGQRFAMKMVKTVVSNLLRNFKIHSLQHTDQILVGGDIILRPLDGMKMVTEERTPS